MRPSCDGSAGPRPATSRPGWGTKAWTRSSTATTWSSYDEENARMDVRTLVEAKARAAREAAQALALSSTRVRNEALQAMARGLEEKTAAILDANRADMERARAAGHPRAFLDRPTLTEPRIEEMAQGLRQIAGLPDPVGAMVESWRRPNGIEIARVRVPLGVVGFIYEARPNVTA